METTSKLNELRRRGAPLKTNADWFPHYRDFASDPRLIPVYKKFGIKNGYANYGMLLELLMRYNNIEIELNEAGLMASSKYLHLSIKKFEEFIEFVTREDIKLFIIEKDMHGRSVLFSEDLLQTYDRLMSKRESNRVSQSNSRTTKAITDGNKSNIVSVDKSIKKELSADSQGHSIVNTIEQTKDTLEEEEREIKDLSVTPSLNESIEYFKNTNSTEVEAKKFFNYYEAKGWLHGGEPVKNWNALAGKWLLNNFTKQFTINSEAVTSIKIRKCNLCHYRLTDGNICYTPGCPNEAKQL